MLLRLHREIKEAVGGGRRLLSLVFGLFSLHASLSDATSVRSVAKSDPWALLGGEQIPVLRCCLTLEPAEYRIKSNFWRRKAASQVAFSSGLSRKHWRLSFPSKEEKPGDTFCKSSIFTFGLWHECVGTVTPSLHNPQKPSPTPRRERQMDEWMEGRQEAPNQLKLNKRGLGYPSASHNPIMEVTEKHGEVL